MKMLLIALAAVGLSGVANAQNPRGLSLAAAQSKVRASASGQLIVLDGMNSSYEADVNLPDGTSLNVTSVTLVQLANAICDTATVKPTGGAGRVIYCIAQ